MWVEGGYTCGNKVMAEAFYSQRRLRCGNYIETTLGQRAEGFLLLTYVQFDLRMMILYHEMR